MRIDFIKCHGSGNDFVLIDRLSAKVVPDANGLCCLGDDGASILAGDALRSFTRLICDRKGPVGADGVLLLLPSDKADARMRMFNPDGSEAEMCGNGIRCVARLAFEIIESGNSENGNENQEHRNSGNGLNIHVKGNSGNERVSIRIETAKSVLECRRERELFGGVESFSVLIDNVSLTSSSFSLATDKPFIDSPITELSATGTFTFVSLGNPHIVSNRSPKYDNNMAAVEPALQESKSPIDETSLVATGIEANRLPSIFPEGVNVTFYVPRGRQTIYTETYERGAGLTQACGTAMSACSIACCIEGLCREGEWIDVYNKGGMARCLVEETIENKTLTTGANADCRQPERLTVRLLGNATFEYSASTDFYSGTSENMAENKLSPSGPIGIQTNERNRVGTSVNGEFAQLGPVYQKVYHAEEIAAYEQFLESVTA